jgi:hypothetical protein
VPARLVRGQGPHRPFEHSNAADHAQVAALLEAAINAQVSLY